MDAGFRPGSRPTFVSAKGGKTIDAPFGLIGLIGREEGGDGLTREAQTSPSRTRASDHRAERQASTLVHSNRCLGFFMGIMALA